jgi:hypothetical protein
MRGLSVDEGSDVDTGIDGLAEGQLHKNALAACWGSRDLYFRNDPRPCQGCIAVILTAKKSSASIVRSSLTFLAQGDESRRDIRRVDGVAAAVHTAERFTGGLFHRGGYGILHVNTAIFNAELAERQRCFNLDALSVKAQRGLLFYDRIIRYAEVGIHADSGFTAHRNRSDGKAGLDSVTGAKDALREVMPSLINIEITTEELDLYYFAEIGEIDFRRWPA